MTGGLEQDSARTYFIQKGPATGRPTPTHPPYGGVSTVSSKREPEADVGLSETRRENNLCVKAGNRSCNAVGEVSMPFDKAGMEHGSQFRQIFTGLCLPWSEAALRFDTDRVQPVLAVRHLCRRRDLKTAANSCRRPQTDQIRVKPTPPEKGPDCRNRSPKEESSPDHRLRSTHLPL